MTQDSKSCGFSKMYPQELRGLGNVEDELQYDKTKEVMVSASQLLEPQERSVFVSKNGFMGIELDGRRGLAQMTQQVPKRATVMRDIETQSALGISAVSGGSI